MCIYCFNDWPIASPAPPPPEDPRLDAEDLPATDAVQPRRRPFAEAPPARRRFGQT